MNPEQPWAGEAGLSAAADVGRGRRGAPGAAVNKRVGAEQIRSVFSGWYVAVPARFDAGYLIKFWGSGVILHVAYAKVNEKIWIPVYG